jgi:hypothetical protein
MCLPILAPPFHYGPIEASFSLYSYNIKKNGKHNIILISGQIMVAEFNNRNGIFIKFVNKLFRINTV